MKHITPLVEKGKFVIFFMKNLILTMFSFKLKGCSIGRLSKIHGVVSILYILGSLQGPHLFCTMFVNVPK